MKMLRTGYCTAYFPAPRDQELNKSKVQKHSSLSQERDEPDFKGQANILLHI